jgi:hypothetical protein
MMINRWMEKLISKKFTLKGIRIKNYRGRLIINCF